MYIRSVVERSWSHSKDFLIYSYNAGGFQRRIKNLQLSKRARLPVGSWYEVKNSFQLYLGKTCVL
jgi:hypothetical protein